MPEPPDMDMDMDMDTGMAITEKRPAIPPLTPVAASSS
jgi:hypothetical protein